MAENSKPVQGVKPNEVYKDGDGTLMTPADESGAWFFAFGVTDPVSITNPLVVEPVTLVVTAEGKVIVDDLGYPTDTITTTTEDSTTPPVAS